MKNILITGATGFNVQRLVKATDSKIKILSRKKQHDFETILDELEQAVDSGDQDKLRQLIIKAVPGFKPQSNIADILYDA
ncbi:hypothetical protein N9522_06915 [Candidatus Thioglobus sp.]|nr:hypothetical protein [Candidatus Thioglobus sp.]